MGKNYKKLPSGYGMVQTEIMRLPNVSIQAKAIYALLASYTGAKEFCWPSQETIANDMGFKRPHTVSKYIKELEKAGLIKKSKLYPGEMKNHNKYEVMYIESTGEKASKAPEKASSTYSKKDFPDTSKGMKNNNIDNNNKLNNIGDKSSHTELVKIFSEQYRNLYDEKLAWSSKELGQLKSLYTKHPKEKLLEKMRSFYTMCEKDKFWTFTPAQLASAWNRVTKIKAGGGPVKNSYEWYMEQKKKGLNR